MALLTAAQRTTLKAAILADPVMSQHVSGPATDYAMIADWLNAPSAPGYFCWLTSVSVTEIMQNGFDWTRVDNLTVGKARIWEFMTAASVLNPSHANVRAGFEACFSVEAGDQATRQAIYNSCVRNATRAEQLLATGSGTAPTHHGVGPATFGFQGTIGIPDVGELLAA